MLTLAQMCFKIYVEEEGAEGEQEKEEKREQQHQQQTVIETPKPAWG